MWTVVYIARSAHKAQSLEQKLMNEGIMVKLRPVGSSDVKSAESVEVLVPESEAEEATELINTILSS